MKKLLLQKNGWIAMELARLFLTFERGDRIPTVSFFCDKYGTARGTVQIALKLLCESEALVLASRGTLGTFIEKINYSKLLELADINSIIGVMPLPYSTLYEGFASGIYSSITVKEFPLYLAYMRGAENRIRLLCEKRYSFATVSRLAANKAIKDGYDIVIAMSFGKHTYVNHHGIIFRENIDKKIVDGLRVGVDKKSIDQATLTKICFSAYDVEYIDLSYNQILKMLQLGKIDAAVWNLDELTDTQMKNRTVILDDKIDGIENTEAVIVVNKSEDYLCHVLNKFIHKDIVLDVQKAVLKGEKIPCY